MIKPKGKSSHLGTHLKLIVAAAACVSMSTIVPQVATANSGSWSVGSCSFSGSNAVSWGSSGFQQRATSATSSLACQDLSVRLCAPCTGISYGKPATRYGTVNVSYSRSEHRGADIAGWGTWRPLST